MHENGISECTDFFYVRNPNTWSYLTHLPIQIRTMFRFLCTKNWTLPKGDIMLV